MENRGVIPPIYMSSISFAPSTHNLFDHRQELMALVFIPCIIRNIEDTGF